MKKQFKDKIKPKNGIKRDIYFIRWGNLNSVKHNEGRLGSENDKRSYHTAPCYKGIYAFPQGYIEPFLLGGSYADSRTKFLLDENGEKIESNDFYEDELSEKFDIVIKPKYRKLLKKRGIRSRDITSYYDEEKEVVYVKYTYLKPKKFKYTGDIWHHLKDFVKNKNDIQREVNSWVKTSYKVYIDALNRCDIQSRFEAYLGLKKSDKFGLNGDPHTTPLKFFSKDHFEVFIEHVK